MIKCLNIKLLIILSAALLGSALKAQVVDTSYRTTYYEQKVTMFRLQGDTKGEIVFIGDSITDIAEWGEIWSNKKVRNRGISTDNTFGVLARLDEVLSAQPKKIFIMIGINDIARNTPDSVIIDNYRRIVERIKKASPKTQLYIQSILPTNNSFTEFIRYQNKEDIIRKVNTALQNMAHEYGVPYVDLHTAFVDEEGKLNKRFTNDGVHINGYGYAKWKEILQQKRYMN